MVRRRRWDNKKLNEVYLKNKTNFFEEWKKKSVFGLILLFKFTICMKDRMWELLNKLEKDG